MWILLGFLTFQKDKLYQEWLGVNWYQWLKLCCKFESLGKIKKEKFKENLRDNTLYQTLVYLL